MHTSFSTPSLLYPAAAMALLLVHAPAALGQHLVTQERARAAVRTPSGLPTQTINAVVTTTESVIAVEGETNSLVVFAFDGQEQSRISNTAAGGAMLAYPIDMALNEGVELLVLDAQTPRIARFSLDNSSLRLRLLSVIRLRGVTGVSAVCSLKGKTFVLGSTPPDTLSRLVHVVGRDGEVQSSFGEGFGPPREFSRILFGTGSLLCVPDEELIVVASQYYPEVRAYDEAGFQRWSQELSEYRGMSYAETAPGRIEYSYPADSLWDQTVSLFRPKAGILALQVGRRYGRRPTAPFRSLRTMLFSTKDGHLLNVQTDLPLIKDAGSGRLISVDDAGSLRILSYVVSEKSRY